MQLISQSYEINNLLMIEMKNMALIVGQLERLTNSELQKQFIKDKARGKEHLWQSPTNRRHQENLRDLHERARGKHGNIRHDK